MFLFSLQNIFSGEIVTS